MCRLFAFVAPTPATAREELGPDGLGSMLSLARLHTDGWGWAGVAEPGGAPTVRKSARSAVTDVGFDRALRTPARAAMVHLRWATAGLPVADDNAHPFCADGVSFAHNGSVKPLDRLRGMLSDDGRVQLIGDTDSEMYFMLIREAMSAGVGAREATVQVVTRLREEFPLASLNALLLTADELIVVHASASSILTEDDLDRLAPLAGALPSEHNEDYFALRWRRSADGTVAVGSTGVDGEGWHALPAESVSAIRFDDRAVVSVELRAAALTRH